jgi:CubicO group peptidase (beta-lactamase class C family)
MLEVTPIRPTGSTRRTTVGGSCTFAELTRTARIAGSDNTLDDLPRRLGDIRSFAFDHVDRRWTIGEMLEATYTDGFMVVHDGEVLFENYGGFMQPRDTHLLMSVSKSLTATLAGVLVGNGTLDTARFVPDYIPALRGTAWEGCTLQHLLDMRAGTLFDEENYDDPDSDGRLIEQVSGYTSLVRTDLPANTYEWISKCVNSSDHGGAFQYRSILPDVLAWVMCEATGQTFAELFSHHIWHRVAQHDADIIVDSAGFPVVEGGICTTLEDLARFGLMCLQRGELVPIRSCRPSGCIARPLVTRN